MGDLNDFDIEATTSGNETLQAHHASVSPPVSQESAVLMPVDDGNMAGGFPSHSHTSVGCSSGGSVDTRVNRDGFVYNILQDQSQTLYVDKAPVPYAMSSQSCGAISDKSNSQSSSALARSFLEMAAHEDAQRAAVKAMVEKERLEGLARDLALQLQQEKEQAEKERAERELAAAAECPICFESIETKEALVACKQCRNSFHKDCIQVYWLRYDLLIFHT